SGTAAASNDAASLVNDCLNAKDMQPGDIFARCVLADSAVPDNREVLSVLARLALKDLGSFAVALPFLRRLDELGDASAPYEIGWAYFRGDSVEEDEPKAAEYF